MVSDILYSVGEAILLDVEDIDNVTYPQGEENPSELVIVTKSQQKYRLAIEKIN